MKHTTKQTALKVSLLVILAANVSWHFPRIANSADFASGAVSSETGSSHNAPHVVVVPMSTVPSVSSTKSEAATSVAAAPLATKRTITYCDKKFEIRWDEIQQDGLPWTRALVYDLNGAGHATKAIDMATSRGKLAVNLKSQTSRDEIYQKIKRDLNEMPFCKNVDHSATTQFVDRGIVPRSADGAVDDDADRIARGIKNCSLDQRGNALNSDRRYDCNLARLQKITLDQDEDQQDDRIHRTHSSAGLAKVMSILRPLKQNIKSLLLSSKEDKRSDGLDRLTEVVDALKDIKDTASGEDARKIQQAIDGMDKGFRVGEAVELESASYQTELSNLATDINGATVGMKTAQNPYVQQQYGMALQQLNARKQALTQEVSSNADWMKLSMLNQSQVLETSDYQDFSADYQALLNQINGTSTAPSTAGAASTVVPQNLVPNRQQINPNGQAINPNINYQMLGLPTPTYTGQTGYPQAPYGQPGYAQQPAPMYPTPASYPVAQYPAPQYPTPQYPGAQPYPQPQYPQPYPQPYPQQPYNPVQQQPRYY